MRAVRTKSRPPGMASWPAGMIDVLFTNRSPPRVLAGAAGGSLGPPQEWSRDAANLTPPDRHRPGRHRPVPGLRPVGALLRGRRRRSALQPPVDGAGV